MSDILIIGIANWATGDRGPIDNDDIREGNLVAPAGPLHQRLEHEPHGAFEVREVRDGRDISQYDGSWTLYYDDGTTHTEGDWRSAVAQAFNSGKTLVDVDGVVPIPESDIDIANDIIQHGLPPKFNGDVDTVEAWASENGVSLPSDTYKKMRTAFEEGCTDVTKTEPPTL